MCRREAALTNGAASRKLRGINRDGRAEGMLPGSTESYEHSSNQHDPIINIHRAQTKYFILELLINQREKKGEREEVRRKGKIERKE